MYELTRETYEVVWIRHGVEGSNSQWVLIQHIEVSIILRKTTKVDAEQSIVFFKKETNDVSIFGNTAQKFFFLLYAVIMKALRSCKWTVAFSILTTPRDAPSVKIWSCSLWLRCYHLTIWRLWIFGALWWRLITDKCWFKCCSPSCNGCLITLKFACDNF